jgi:hypothetical protein
MAKIPWDFETSGCPTCRKSISSIDDELVLVNATVDGDTERAGSY